MVSKKILLVLGICVPLDAEKGGVCPICKEPYALVSKTRISPYDENEVFRRHTCRECGRIFQTVGVTGQKLKQKRIKRGKNR